MTLDLGLDILLGCLFILAIYSLIRSEIYQRRSDRIMMRLESEMDSILQDEQDSPYLDNGEEKDHES